MPAGPRRCSEEHFSDYQWQGKGKAAASLKRRMYIQDIDAAPGRSSAPMMVPYFDSLI
jgi:hypothetical protein